MTPVNRWTLITTLALALGAGVAAQESSTQATTTTTSTSTETAAKPQSTATTVESVELPEQTETAVEEGSPESRRARTRENFIRLLSRHRPQLGRALALEPNLLSNDSFLANYPELLKFVNEHPEIRSNPHFYLADFQERPQIIDDSPTEEFFEALVIILVFALISFALGWLIRTIIEQKRWNRLAARQSEVHNKILDRFGSTDELLQYIKSPAGEKFLESAPIPVQPAKQTSSGSMTRVIWSIQIGVIIAAGGLGLVLASLRFEKDPAEGLFAMGMIALCTGAGFVASALVSLNISRRLGPFGGSASNEDLLDDSGGMR